MKKQCIGPACYYSLGDYLGAFVGEIDCLVDFLFVRRVYCLHFVRIINFNKMYYYENKSIPDFYALCRYVYGNERRAVCSG